MMKLLIFDYDGPINNLTQSKKDTILNLSDELSLNLSNQNVWELINYIDQIYESQKITDYVQLISIALKKMKGNNSIKILEEQIDQFSLKFGKKLDMSIRLNLEIIKTIREIKNKQHDTKVCIYTSQLQDNLQIFLNRIRDDRILIDKIYDRNSFDEPKPSTQNLIQICKDFECNFGEAIIIGDNVAVDLAPAAYLGIKTILINQFVDIAIKHPKSLKHAIQKFD